MPMQQHLLTLSISLISYLFHRPFRSMIISQSLPYLHILAHMRKTSLLLGHRWTLLLYINRLHQANCSLLTCFLTPEPLTERRFSRNQPFERNRIPTLFTSNTRILSRPIPASNQTLISMASQESRTNIFSPPTFTNPRQYHRIGQQVKVSTSPVALPFNGREHMTSTPSTSLHSTRRHTTPSRAPASTTAASARADRRSRRRRS
jgi:hypothetical protein